MRALIAILPGDGIGPEVVAQATRVLQAVAGRFGHSFETRSGMVGGIAIDRTGFPLPPATLDLCQSADAVLLGAVGGPKWGPEASPRPEQGLLALRQALGLFANLRPIRVHRRLAAASPIKAEVLAGADLLFVRELTGGLYFGEKRREANRAIDTCAYSDEEVIRVVRVACREAKKRGGRLTSVDKANVLETSRLWRSVTARVVREEFPELQLEHQLVDAFAMNLIAHPSRFDVVVTENMFGDILTDEASVLCGSIGLLPSASLGAGTRGLYEPVHGSAPDIAGLGVANPYGAISSAAMLLRHSLGLEQEARAVEQAVAQAIDFGALTGDLASDRGRSANTKDVGEAVLAALAQGA